MSLLKADSFGAFLKPRTNAAPAVERQFDRFVKLGVERR